jgi:ABC-type spermidine/putrescine transport system permease subunit II/DNA-binding beta-propeller fold protein YncE
VLAAVATTFVLTLNQFTIPALLQVKVFPAEVWVSFNTTFDYFEALRVGWPMMAVALLVLMAAVMNSRSSGNSGRWLGQSPSTQLFRQRLGLAGRWLPALSGVLILFLCVALPLGELVLEPRTWSEFLPALQAGKAALGWSLGLSMATAALVVAFKVGQASCLPLRSVNSKWAAKMAVLPWLLFFVPGVVLGITMIWLLNRPLTGWLYGSFGVVLLAWGLRYAAPGWSLLSAALNRVDHRLTELVRMEGGGRFAVFRLAVWPQIASAAAVAAFIVFLFCLWDVETLVLIVPPGVETLSLRIFNLLHYGHNPQVSALCLILLGVAVMPLVVGCLWRVAGGGWLKGAWMLALGAFLVGCSEKLTAQNPLSSRFFSEVKVIGSRGAGVGQFNKPRSVGVDRDDNLYVVDMMGRVQKFAPDGAFLLSWQMPQTEQGKAKGMVTDADGNLALIEPHYSRMNHFDSAGQVLAQWGAHGTNAGQLSFPRGAAVNSHGDMFLCEYGQTERIQRFSHRGTNYLGGFGRPGEGEGEFNRVEGVGIGPDDLIYAADSCNHRIQVFTAEGKFVRQFGRAGSGPGELSYPYDVRLDQAGNVFVCEFGNSRIQVFDKAGKSVEIIGGPGGGPGQFSNPWSICLDSRGNLYVADSQNHRVQKLVRTKVGQASCLPPDDKIDSIGADSSNSSMALNHQNGSPGQAGSLPYLARSFSSGQHPASGIRHHSK